MPLVGISVPIFSRVKIHFYLSLGVIFFMVPMVLRLTWGHVKCRRSTSPQIPVLQISRAGKAVLIRIPVGPVAGDLETVP